MALAAVAVLVAPIGAKGPKRDDVVYAEENGIASATLDAADDSQFASQWALSKIGALNAWSIFPGSYEVPDGPPIAVVDSGVDAAHPDLTGRVATDLGRTA